MKTVGHHWLITKSEVILNYEGAKLSSYNI